MMMPTVEEEQRLIQQHLLENNQQEWEKVMQLAEGLSRRICPSNLRSLWEKDLVQEAVMALCKNNMKYVKKFEPDRGYKFSTYVYIRMKYAMLNFLVQQETIRFPRIVRQILKKYEELWDKLEHEPSPEEVVQELSNTSIRHVENALQWRDLYAVRIDQQSESTDEDKTIFEPASETPSPEEETLTQEQEDMIQIGIRMLHNPNHATVYFLSEYDGASENEIVQSLNNVPLGTVKGWKNRAKEDLIKSVTVLLEGDGKSDMETSRKTGISVKKVKEWWEGYRVLKLYSLVGFSPEEICKRTGLDSEVVGKWVAHANSVNSHLEQARQRLNEIRATSQRSNDEGGGDDV